MNTADTPAGRIARLDASLAKHGETVTLRRFTGSGSSPLATWADTSAQAKVAALSSDEIAAGITMAGRKVILSPTDAGGFSPAINKDAVLIDGVKRVIQDWNRIKVGDVVVRIEGRVA